MDVLRLAQASDVTRCKLPVDENEKLWTILCMETPLKAGRDPVSLSTCHPPMMKTIVKLEGVELPPQTVSALERGFTETGIDGTLTVGTLRALPEMVYFLWHAPGEVPVSMTVRRCDLDHPDLENVIAPFMSKWQRRLQ